MAVEPWEWLTLIDAEGPFLSRAALKSFYPFGLPKADSSVDDVNATFVDEFVRWSRGWQTDSAESYQATRDRWIEAVLRTLLGWSDDVVLQPGELSASSPNESVLVAPWAALENDGTRVALVAVVDRTENLRRVGADGWSANAIDRMALLLRETGVSIGVVTDGRWWALVSASKDVTTASGVWDALLWREEKPSRDAFFALLNFRSIVGLPQEKKLSLLFTESVASAEQITEALGDQVRRAVEVVLQSMSDTHLRALGRGDESPLPADAQVVYEASVMVLMRIVFLLFAEERGLLPEHDLYRSSYAIAEIREQLQREATASSVESLDHSSEAWHRLLAASNAVYGGASFEDMRMPAYGGSLFDPDRFPWLQATDEQGRLRVRLTDRAMFAVLRAVQTIEDGAMRLSFRDLDVEQIGYVYEGLLGYSAEYASEVVVGLKGRSGFEPEVPLSELEAIAQSADGARDLGKLLSDHLKKTQAHSKPQTAKQLEQAYANDDLASAADARTRLRHALLNNDDLAERLVPFHALIRSDLRGFPYVVPAQGLVMTESPQRANTGTHYTPRSLAEEVVLHALEPLVYSPGPLDTENADEWVLKSSAEILDLKVADIAAGSGAFLVAAARYLADRLIEARANEGIDNSAEVDLRRWAIREVVARCLYGADINGMAVEMCKLSLWLISMDPGKPFSFVDDRVFHGNSLLGVTSEEQLKAQHIYPENRASRAPLRWFNVDKDLDDATRLRRELSSGQVDEVDRMRSTRAKQSLLAQFRQVTAKLHDVADGIIAAGVLEGGKPGKKLEECYDELADALREAYPDDKSVINRSHLRQFIERSFTAAALDGAQLNPIHWILEAPDVMRNDGGFDAIIGNPPFLGGSLISGAIGPNLREWLVEVIAEGKRGTADLVAYFFLRAGELIRYAGTFGLIATNTVAQGATRQVGLGQLLSEATLYRSVRSAPWPARSAALEYAAVWGTKRSLDVTVPRLADTQKCVSISSLLEPDDGTTSVPSALKMNSKIAFIGTYLHGNGFTVSPDQANAWIQEDSANASVLYPFLNGDDLNSTSDTAATRWVVDFTGLEREEASKFTRPFEQVRTHVRPMREPHGGKLAERWWLFKRPAPAMRRAIASLSEVFVIARVSKVVMPVRVPATQVLGDSLTVFASDDWGILALLSSTVHRCWAIKYGSTLETRVRYTPSDVFETFPMPTTIHSLRLLGERLDQTRREIMTERNLGLTATYNLVNSPRVVNDTGIDALRAIHQEIDEAVIDAYQWSDLSLEYGFHVHRQVESWTVNAAARVEILDRLLKENHRRAALEAVLAAPERGSGKPLEDSERPEGAMF